MKAVVIHALGGPDQLTLAGRVIRGRIDAVYRDRDGGPDGTTYEIVDWKTNRSRSADDLQLAVYRLAWAEQHDVPLDRVTAAFLYVRTGEIIRRPALPRTLFGVILTSWKSTIMLPRRRSSNRRRALRSSPSGRW